MARSYYRASHFHWGKKKTTIRSHWTKLRKNNMESQTNPPSSVAMLKTRRRRRRSGNWTYGKGFDTPDENILFGDVADASDGSLELGWIGIGRNRNYHLDVVSGGAAFKLRSSLNHVLYARVGVSFNHRFDPDQRLHLLPIQWNPVNG